MQRSDKSFSEQHYDAIVAELDRRFRKAGYGSKKRALEKLGLKRDYLKSSHRRRALKLKVLADLAEILGTTLPELVVAASRNFPDWHIEPSVGNPPETVQRVLQELQQQPPSQQQRTPSADVASDLGELSHLRLEDPAACLQALQRFPTVDLCRLQRIQFLTILGATFRRLVQLLEANHALYAAYELCQADDPLSMQADILLKLAHLEYENGRLHRALQLTERAISWFETDQNHRGVGGALLDYAMWLHNDGQLTKALAALQAAEPKIDPENIEDRFMHCAGMATLLECRGELRRALHFQERASRLAARVPKTLLPSLFVTGGRLKAQLGEAEGAVEEFLSARDTYLEIKRPISSAMAVIDALQLLISTGDKERGVAIALDMARLIFPLAETSPMAEAAVADLVIHVQQRRRLKPERLEGLKKQLNAAEAELVARRRKDRPWR